MVKTSLTDVAIIGAGPYGLSIAAHLDDRSLADPSLNVRLFGSPMSTWRTQMPDGMRLKSDGFASSLYDPYGEYPLSRYCRDHDIPYADTGLPVARQTFADYGQEFARRFVPMLEDRTVAALRLTRQGFELEMADGETIAARQVICAAGISHYAYVAPSLAGLPPALMSHSSAHHDLSPFRGKTVAVVGGGASATDCAAGLAEAGAIVHLFTRRAALAFHAPPRARSLAARVRSPRSTLGLGWRSWLCTHAPLLFHAMPQEFRLNITRSHLGPAPCWFVRDQIERSVTVHHGVQISHASARDGRAVLEWNGQTMQFDHVLAATGYKVDLGRLKFLDHATRQMIRMEQDTPELSQWFQSSVPGLYFVGTPAANAFGPLLRFACGAKFTARRLARHFR